MKISSHFKKFFFWLTSYDDYDDLSDFTWGKFIKYILLVILYFSFFGGVLFLGHMIFLKIPYLLEIVIGIAITYIYIATLIFIYKLNSKDPDFWEVNNLKFWGLGRPSKIDIYIIIGAFIGLTILFYNALLSAMFFIPDSWGGFNEDGEWSSIKESVSAMGGLVVQFGFIYFVKSMCVYGIRPILRQTYCGLIIN